MMRAMDKLHALAFFAGVLAWSIFCAVSMEHAAEATNHADAADFYYYFASGGCLAHDNQGNVLTGNACDGYPLGSKIYYPLTLFGLDTFRLLSKTMVFFVPAALFFLLFGDWAVALVYLISPVPFFLASDGILAQFLAMVALMIVVRFRSYGVVFFSMPISLLLQRYAIWLFSAFAVFFVWNPDIQKMKTALFYLSLACFAVLLFSLRQFTYFSIYQPSYASLLLFTLPVICLVYGRKTIPIDKCHVLLLVVFLAAMCAIICLWPLVSTIPPITGLEAFNIARFITLLDFVLLIGIADGETIRHYCNVIFDFLKELNGGGSYIVDKIYL